MFQSCREQITLQKRVQQEQWQKDTKEHGMSRAPRETQHCLDIYCKVGDVGVVNRSQAQKALYVISRTWRLFSRTGDGKSLKGIKKDSEQ